MTSITYCLYSFEFRSEILEMLKEKRAEMSSALCECL